MASSVTIEQMTTLSEEIAALVAAGVPLEAGLSAIGSDLPGRVGRIASNIGAQLEQGKDLSAALREVDSNFPDYFPALVEAGAKSGRLGIALEAMADCGRRLHEVRRNVALGLVYPITLLLVAYGLFFSLVVRSVVSIGASTEFLRIENTRIADWVASLEGTDPILLALIPIALLIAVGIWLRATGRAKLLQSSGLKWGLGWLRPVRRMLRASRYCSFADILALLIEQRVAAPDAIRLAAAASGDQQLAAAGNEMAAELERGQQPGDSDFPPLMRWLISGFAAGRANAPEALARGLRMLAENQREHAMLQADWLRIYLPTLGILAVGLVVTLVFVLSIWLPYLNVVNHLL
jgi:general secretion pathway protein F